MHAARQSAMKDDVVALGASLSTLAGAVGNLATQMGSLTVTAAATVTDNTISTAAQAAASQNCAIAAFFRDGGWARDEAGAAGSSDRGTSGTSRPL